MFSELFPWPWVRRTLSLLTFLGIPSKYKEAAVELTVLALVKALYFMHQAHFAGMHGESELLTISRIIPVTMK
jgi:hypothetical protein